MKPVARRQPEVSQARLSSAVILAMMGHGRIPLLRKDTKVEPKCMKCNKPIFADDEFVKTSLGKMHEPCGRIVANAVPIESTLEAPPG